MKKKASWHLREKANERKSLSFKTKPLHGPSITGIPFYTPAGGCNVAWGGNIELRQ